MKKEITSSPEVITEAKTFLNSHHKMVLTVLDQDRHPDSSLMLYAIDDEFNFYFGTCKCFGKYKALSAYPHVSMAVTQELLDPLQVIDAKGIAEELSPEETEERLAWFVKKNPAKYYVKDAEDFVMFRIKPHGLRWLDATSGELEIHTLSI